MLYGCYWIKAYLLRFLMTKKTINAPAMTTANVPTTTITIFIFSGSVPTASNAVDELKQIGDYVATY